MQNANINTLAAVTENLKKVEPNFEELLHSAEDGDAEAQYHIGSFYLKYADDNNVILEEAARWLSLASDKGDAHAQYYLALIYLYGWGVEEDIEKAEKLLRSAATQGLPHAQNALGKFCEDYGRKSEPASWYLKAAEQGDADAQYNLGRLIQLGISVPETSYHDEADQWLREAGADIEQYRDVTDDPSEAIRWLSAAAKQGHVDALFLLAKMYDSGEGCTKNLKEARELYQLAAERGHTEAMLKLSDIYKHGRGVNSDTEKAKALLLKAAEDSAWGEDELKEYAQRWYEKHRRTGFEELSHPKGLFKKLDRAIDVGVARGFPVAFVLRGMSCFALENKNYQAAKTWFQRAENMGDALSAYYLALMSLRGLGGNESFHLASIHFDKCINSLCHYDDLYRSTQTIMEHTVEQPDKNYYDPAFEISLLGTARSQQIDVKITLKQEETRKELLSFLSHTLSNASAGAQDTIRRAARLLGTVQADKPETLRRAMERLSGQIASLALIETLVASFKLYASDPDRVRESWDNEQAGEIAFVRVLALALRQVLTRLFTLPGHALDLRRLLPENGEVLAREFVADIMVLDLESDAEAERLIAWVRDKLPFLELRVEDDASLRFAQGGARFVVVFAVLAEILTNAVKYASASPITLACELTVRRLRVACRNRVQARPLQALDSGGTGITFLREICRIVGADIQDSLDESGQFEVVFRAKA